MEHYRYLFHVSYDGTDYSGFQRQENSKSIQGEIERALKGMTANSYTIHSAGRTDKGVHALDQTFHLDLPFEIEIDKWIKGINFRLPSDIRINKIKQVDNRFHARHNAKFRVYEYKIAKKESDIFNQRYEVYIENFNIELAIEASLKFIGTKDFTGFSKISKDKEPIRTITEISVKETKDYYYFKFVGISFLRYMVRSIMGTIIAVATDKMSIEVIDEIFETKNRMLAGKTAEAKGLYFKKVIY